MSNVRTCPDCGGRKGRHLRSEERKVLRMKLGMDPRSTETPYFYETLPAFQPCPLCEGGGTVVCEAASAAGGRKHG